MQTKHENKINVVIIKILDKCRTPFQIMSVVVVTFYYEFSTQFVINDLIIVSARKAVEQFSHDAHQELLCEYPSGGFGLL